MVMVWQRSRAAHGDRQALLSHIQPWPSDFHGGLRIGDGVRP
jgi:hypothetical protein